MHDEIADQLAALYEAPFGSKKRGRYRISMKLLCRLAKRRRLYPEDKIAIGRALYERGYVMIDMETYFAVLSQRTLQSYRRFNTPPETRDQDSAQSSAGDANEKTV